MNISYGVMALKTKSDKESIRTLAYQVCQITTHCVKQNIKIVDCIVTFGGIKDFLREIKKLDTKKEFNYLLIYSPHQIAKSEQEYLEFANILEKDFQIEIKYLRS